MFINYIYAEEEVVNTFVHKDSDTISLQNSDIPLKNSDSYYNNWISLIPMVLIFLVFYFLLFRPQEKYRRMQQELVSSIKKGEEILTNSGIIGIVTKINENDNTMLVSVAENVEIKILKTSISDILNRKKSKEQKTVSPSLSKK